MHKEHILCLYYSAPSIKLIAMINKFLPFPVILPLIVLLECWLVGDNKYITEILIFIGLYLAIFWGVSYFYQDKIKFPSREDRRYIRISYTTGHQEAEDDLVQRQSIYFWLNRMAEDRDLREKLFAAFLVFLIIGTWTFKSLNENVIYQRAVILTCVCVSILVIITIDLLRKRK